MMSATDTALFVRELPALRAQVGRFVRRQIDGSSAADNLTDDILSRVWEAYATREMPRPFPRTADELRALVFQAARHRMIDHFRSRRGPALLTLDDLTSDHTATVHPDPLTPLIVREAIEDLPPEERDAVLAVHFADRTREEHAADTGVGPRQIDTRLHRARQKLRAALGGLV